jgi:FAD/FMN-containing dehydrogenase
VQPKAASERAAGDRGIVQIHPLRMTARVKPDRTAMELVPPIVEELAIETADGLKMRVGATTEEEFEELCAAAGRRGEIYRALHEFRERHGDDVRKRFSSLAPLLPGIRLEFLLPENRCDLAKALAGSGSTCVRIVEATVKLERIPEHRSLVVFRFPDPVKAAEKISEIQKHEPLAIEALGGKLIVELAGEDASEVRQRGEGLVEVFAREPHAPEMELVLEAQDRRRVWEERDDAVAAIPNPERAIAPPHRLAPLVEELLHLLERYGGYPQVCGDYNRGNVMCGVDRNLFTADGRADYERFACEAAHACARVGGTFSARYCSPAAGREVMRVLYGEEMLSALDEFKGIWDPQNRMEPIAPPR